MSDEGVARRPRGWSILNPWRGLQGLPREVWALSAAMLVNRAGTMALPFLVLYLTQHLGFSAGRGGLVLAVYGIGAIFAGPFSGWLSDRIGPLRVMKISLLLSGLMLLLFPVARGLAALAATTFVWSIVSEAFRPASLAVVTDLVSPEKRRPAYALTRLAINLGMSVGPAAGGFLAVISFPTLFLVDGATSLLACGLLAVLPWRIQVSEAGNGTAPPGVPLFSPRAIADHRMLFFLAAVVLIALVFFQHEAALALFLVRDLGLSESAYGLLFSINSLVVVLLEVPLNAATASWPHGRSLALGALLVGAGFGSLVFASSFWGVAVAVVIWSFGEMILFPSMPAYVADIAPPERRGEYMGLYTMAFSLAFAFGPWGGVLVFERFGAPVLWATAFLAGCLSAAMMIGVGRERLAH